MTAFTKWLLIVFTIFMLALWSQTDFSDLRPDWEKPMPAPKQDIDRSLPIPDESIVQV